MMSGTFATCRSSVLLLCFFFFFFQAEDGIRDLIVTGVQTCALPISLPPVRVYAPVGTHEDLLPYLVRRLLENGANSSFVHQFMNPQIPVEQVEIGRASCRERV